jgi:RND family efflux transporter MFP subunit
MVVVLALVAAGCSSGPEVAKLPPPEVTVSQPIQRDVVESFDTTGRAAAVESVEVRARVSGYLTKIGFGDGAEVKAGDVLFEIDPRPYEAALQQAKGEEARWQASLVRALSEVRRVDRLLSKGAASEREMEAAIASRDTAKAEIQSAQGRLEKAQLDLEFTRVVAPVAGRVSKTNLTIGNLIQAGTIGSDPLTTLVSVAPIYIYFDIDERTLLRAQERRRQQGQDSSASDIRALAIPVEVGLATEQGHPHRGILDFVDNRVDPSTGTLKARAVFDNADRVLTPGLFTRVRLPIGDPRASVLVAERAVGIDQGNRYVLVVDDKNTVQYRAVKLGQRAEGGLRVVDEGLEPGEWLITNGIQRARPGITVEPKRAEMAPTA